MPLATECKEILDRVSSDKKELVEEIKNRLPEHKPVWLIGQDSTVIAANLLALWLWDVLSPEIVQSEKLPPLRTFKIFSQNFKRIPLEENEDFYEDFYKKKSIDAKVIERFSGEDPVRDFKQSMLNDPQLKEIYEKASREEISQTFDFRLNIRPPKEPTSSELLQFQINATLLFNSKKELIGWGTVYTPLGETESIIETKYKQLRDEYGKIPYVITDTGELYDVRIDNIMKGTDYEEEGGDVPLNNKELPQGGSNPQKERALRFANDEAFLKGVTHLWHKQPFELGGWHCLIVPDNVANDVLSNFTEKEVKEIELVNLADLPEEEALRRYAARFKK